MARSPIIFLLSLKGEQTMKESLKKALVASLAVVATTLIKTVADNYIYESSKTEDGPSVFSEAVKAITNSDMFSSAKQEAIKALRRNESPEYYRSIIAIVSDNSSFSSTRLESIRSL